MCHVLVTVAPRHILGQSPAQGAQHPVPAWVPGHSQPSGTLLPVCSHTRFSSKPLSTVGGVLVTSRFGEFLAVMSGPPGAQDPVGGWKVNSVFVVTQTYYLLLSRCWRGPAPHCTGRGHGNNSWTGSQPGLGVSGRSGEHMEVGPSDLREGRFGRGCPEGRGLDRAACGVRRTFHVMGSRCRTSVEEPAKLSHSHPWIFVFKPMTVWLGVCSQLG